MIRATILCLCLLLCALPFPTSGIEPDPDPSAFAKAGGKKVLIEGDAFWRVEIPKSIHADINSARKLQGTAIQPLEKVNREPWANLEYLSDWLLMVRTELATAMNRPPSDEELFSAWKIGVKEFQKLGFNPANIKGDEFQLRLELLKALVSKPPQPANPPPLPTDGRKPVPARYPKENSPPAVRLGDGG